MFDLVRTTQLMAGGHGELFEFEDHRQPFLAVMITRFLDFLWVMCLMLALMTVLQVAHTPVSVPILLLAAAVGSPMPVIGWRDLLNLMATVFSYGGKAITTNRLRAGGTEPLNAGWGIGVNTSLASDTALSQPSAEARVAGTSSQQTTNANIPNDTYQVIATITASSSRSITEFGLFDTVTAAPQTTLSAAITTTGQTAITVTSAAGFPGSGVYYFQCDQEVMSVTAGQGTTSWTITRGARGSTAATHLISKPVVGGEACAGGNMFMKGDFSVISLNNGDSIQFTAQVQYT